MYRIAMGHLTSIGELKKAAHPSLEARKSLHTRARSASHSVASAFSRVAVLEGGGGRSGSFYVLAHSYSTDNATAPF